MDYSNILTPEIEAQMPRNLTPVDEFRWRQNKVNEIKAANKLSQHGGSSAKAEPVQPTTEDVAEKPTSQPEQEPEPEPELEQEPEEKTGPKHFISESTSSENNKNTKNTARNTAFVSPVSKSKDDVEFVKNVPKSVMSAMRRILPDAKNNADLISAFVYIYTSGNCEISSAAMKLVKSFNPDDKILEVAERLANLERLAAKQIQTLQAVELCVSYDTYDRRYGAKENRKSPRETEFREQGNLDMLSRLRQQATDQKKLDDINDGRRIYNQTKDKGD